MATQLRPNGINYTAPDVTVDAEIVVATVQQPMPSSDQAETIVQYFAPQINCPDDTSGSMIYRCYRADPADPADVILGTQVPGEYTLTMTVAAMGTPLSRAFFLLWVDRAPGQAACYAVTAENTGDTLSPEDTMSSALISIGG